MQRNRKGLGGEGDEGKEKEVEERMRRARGWMMEMKVRAWGYSPGCFL